MVQSIPGSPGELPEILARKMHRTVAAAVLVAILAFPSTSNAWKAVSFFKDSVYEIDGRVVRMLGGSTWLMDHEIFVLPFTDVVVIFADPDPLAESQDFQARVKQLPTRGVLMKQGTEVGVTLLSGFFLRSNAHLATVEQAHGDGAILELDDGSLWSVPTYDQYDTGYWLPPYPVIVYGNELYMLNLEKGKRIWVKRIR